MKRIWETVRELLFFRDDGFVDLGPDSAIVRAASSMEAVNAFQSRRIIAESRGYQVSFKAESIDNMRGFIVTAYLEKVAFKWFKPRRIVRQGRPVRLKGIA